MFVGNVMLLSMLEVTSTLLWHRQCRAFRNKMADVSKIWETELHRTYSNGTKCRIAAYHRNHQRRHLANVADNSSSQNQHGDNQQQHVEVRTTGHVAEVFVAYLLARFSQARLGVMTATTRSNVAWPNRR